VRNDLSHPIALRVKGALFALLALLAAALLILESPTWRTVVLVCVLAWAAARTYYFLFYVLERYADPSFRYAGIVALIAGVVRGRRNPT
jgi:hypothetical protein